MKQRIIAQSLAFWCSAPASGARKPLAGVRGHFSSLVAARQRVSGEGGGMFVPPRKCQLAPDGVMRVSSSGAHRRGKDRIRTLSDKGICFVEQSVGWKEAKTHPAAEPEKTASDFLALPQQGEW